MTEEHLVSHEEQLRAEARACPRCGYHIANPLTDRCPRCYERIPRLDPGCGSCMHQGGCEFKIALDQRSSSHTGTQE